ncbi:hypothetical protein DFH09DRAFT_1409209 [Mycena vulgaris]|nr:hypothetical protein DFH09DRAFT_1409209 [Mycena vulgaris]
MILMRIPPPSTFFHRHPLRHPASPMDTSIALTLLPPASSTLLRRPRALLLIAAGALTLVALARFAEYDHGPPLPPPPPSDDDVHPPPSAPPSDDVHTEHSDAALTAPHAAQPPPSPPRARATPSRHRVPRHAASTPSTPSPARPSVPGPQQEARPTQGSIDAIEERLHWTEALVGILLAAAGAGGRVERFGEVSFARAILAPHRPQRYAPAGRRASSSNNHGNYGSAHSTPPPTPVSAHPSTKGPGAINAGPARMDIGSTRCVVFLLSSSSLALFQSFLPPPLVLCGGGVPRPGGRGGDVSKRTPHWCDGGNAVACPHSDPREARTLPPCTSSWHRRIRCLRALLCPAHDARARLRVAYAYTRGMPSPSHSHSGYPRISYTCMYMYYITVHAHAQYTLFPFPFVRVSDSRPSPSQVVLGARVARMKVYLRGAEACASEGINTDTDTEARESWKWTRARNEKAGKEELVQRLYCASRDGVSSPSPGPSLQIIARIRISSVNA